MSSEHFSLRLESIPVFPQTGSDVFLQPQVSPAGGSSYILSGDVSELQCLFLCSMSKSPSFIHCTSLCDQQLLSILDIPGSGIVGNPCLFLTLSCYSAIVFLCFLHF